jgi:hypothetical protein
VSLNEHTLLGGSHVFRQSTTQFHAVSSHFFFNHPSPSQICRSTSILGLDGFSGCQISKGLFRLFVFDSRDWTHYLLQAFCHLSYFHSLAFILFFGWGLPYSSLPPTYHLALDCSCLCLLNSWDYTMPGSKGHSRRSSRLYYLAVSWKNKNIEYFWSRLLLWLCFIFFFNSLKYLLFLHWDGGEGGG